MLTQWLQKTILNPLPKQCELCRLNIDSGSDCNWLCSSCLAYIAPIPRCRRCGLALPAYTELCGQCIQKPPLWHSLTCIGDFSFPLSGFVHAFKHNRAYWQASKLGDLLVKRIATPAPVITWVPLHWKRHLFRGFNQSELLARHLYQQMGGELVSLFTRHRNTLSQQGLDKTSRQRNLKGAFTLKAPTNFQHLAIVDDVVTTGSTLHQLCHLLLQSGVKTIDIYCICRTPEPQKK